MPTSGYVTMIRFPYGGADAPAGADEISRLKTENAELLEQIRALKDEIAEMRSLEPPNKNCSNCKHYTRDHSHCHKHDSLTNAAYRCTGWVWNRKKATAGEQARKRAAKTKKEA